uniref:Endo/exonuclease/phosphatase domain-containing protein n=1 Tax=Rhabditophanes sp. KR3021 TaxID=114890 RepID=A0AC35TKN8_9BILA
MDRLNIDVLMVTETKREAENFTFNHEDKKIITCFFGPFKKIGGVGFLISELLSKDICYSHLVDIRLGRIDLMIGGQRIALIVGYAPTLKGDGTDEFFEALGKLLDIKPFDEVIIGGDFNARLADTCKKRKSSNNFSPVTNANGDALAGFALDYKLSILNSAFPKKKCRRWT